MRRFIRQGEIYLELVDESEIPADYQETPVSQAMLGVGETGNSHVLMAEPGTDTRFSWLHDACEDINAINEHGGPVAKQALYVKIDGPAYIDHSDRVEGHNQLHVPQEFKIARVRIKREGMPFADEANYVRD